MSRNLNKMRVDRKKWEKTYQKDLIHYYLEKLEEEERRQQEKEFISDIVRYYKRSKQRRELSNKDLFQEMCKYWRDFYRQPITSSHTPEDLYYLRIKAEWFRYEGETENHFYRYLRGEPPFDIKIEEGEIYLALIDDLDPIYLRLVHLGN